MIELQGNRVAAITFGVVLLGSSLIGASGLGAAEPKEPSVARSAPDTSRPDDDPSRPNESPSDASSSGQAGEVQTRESVARVTLKEAWDDEGFRLAIGMGYGYLAGAGGSPSMHAFTTAVTAGWRFNDWFGLHGTLRYTVPLTGFMGLRWSATVEPVVWLTTGWMVSLGVGYAGLLGSRPVRSPFPYELYVAEPDRIPLGDQAEPGDIPLFPACDGDGASVLVRTAYLFTVGDVFSTGPSLQVDAQFTRCRDHGFDAVVPVQEWGRLPTQWWTHTTVEFGWLAVWR